MYSEMLIKSFSAKNAHNISLSDSWAKPGVWIAYGKKNNEKN